MILTIKNRKSNLFKGIKIYVNGLTGLYFILESLNNFDLDPPDYKLQKLVLENGGKFSISRLQDFTHVISSSLSNCSFNSFKYLYFN